MGNEAEFVEHLPCENCGSSDANALYDDGHAFCFSCETYTPPDKEKPSQEPKPKSKSDPNVQGQYKELKARGISKETCRLFDYQVGKYKGKAVQIANYKDESGDVVAQKLRFADKDFLYFGEPAKAQLFGQHIWNHKRGSRMVIVTEGEIDALTVSQLQGNQWPVVSIPTGAKGAKRALKRHMDWLLSFDSIVVMFDGDEDGREAAENLGPLFPPRRLYIADLPDGYDPNDLYLEGRGKEVLQLAWNARMWRPGEVLTMADVRDEMVKPVEWGLPWPWESLTQFTYGRRRGEVYTIGAGTGVGKTDFVTECIAHFIRKDGLPVGAIMLEQQARETGQRVAGKIAHKRFHIPDADWTQEELEQTVDWMVETDRLQLYGGWDGSWDELENVIRYWASEGIKDVVVDHLTAIVADADDERKALEETMKQISHLAVQLDITIYLISHLATPDGKPHEEGGRVMLRHFKGSRAIGFWTFFAFGLERNQQADDEVERNTTYVRVLKDRYTGQSVGKVMTLLYDHNTGLLIESEDTHDEFFSDESEGEF